MKRVSQRYSSLYVLVLQITYQAMLSQRKHALTGIGGLGRKYNVSVMYHEQRKFFFKIKRHSLHSPYISLFHHFISKNPVF